MLHFVPKGLCGQSEQSTTESNDSEVVSLGFTMICFKSLSKCFDSLVLLLAKRTYSK